MKSRKNIPAFCFVAAFIAFIFIFGTIAVLKSPDDISKSERRQLAEQPKLTAETAADGSFFTEYSKYLPDQFPLREWFRGVKTVNRLYVLGQGDSHGIFLRDGYAAEISYPLTEKSVEVYIKRLNTACESYFAGSGVKVYNTVIADKAYFLAEKSGRPSIDYNALQSKIEQSVQAEYIGIFDTLDIGCYYKTDSHWQQDKIIPAADRLLEAMGASKNENTYVKHRLEPFYGVYYGLSALPLPPDVINTVGSPVIDTAELTRADKTTGQLIGGQIYKTENITSADPYDVFLEGASTVAVIDNTTLDGGKTLYLISDSFGRSLAPLLLTGYDRVVVFDIRYIKLSSALEKVPLEAGSDVLIAYSISAIDVSSNLQVG